MNNPITEESLLAAGYRKYPVPIGGEGADRFYHKNAMSVELVCPDFVKYSVDVYHYDLSAYIPNESDGYRVEARFQKSNGHCFVARNLEDCSIEDQESFFEKIWQNLPDLVFLDVG